MEVEVKGFKGLLIELQSTVSLRSDFDTPRIVYYEIKLFNPDKRVTIKLEKVYPEEIKVIEKESK